MREEYIIRTRQQKKIEAQRAAVAEQTTQAKKRDAETAFEVEEPATPHSAPTLAELNHPPFSPLKAPIQQNAEATFSPPVTPLAKDALREFLGTPAQEKMGRRKFDIAEDLLDTPSVFWTSPSPAAPTVTVLLTTIRALSHYLQTISTADNFDIADVIQKATDAYENVNAEAQKIAEEHTALKDKYRDFLQKMNSFLMTLRSSMQQELSTQKEVIENFLADMPRTTIKAGI